MTSIAPDAGSIPPPRITDVTSPHRSGPDAPDDTVGYLPILDVARGTAAGFHAVPLDLATGDRRDTDPATAIRVVRAALDAFSHLPTNTFVSVPVPLRLTGSPPIRDALRGHGDLAGIVLDVTDFSPDGVGDNEEALEEYRHRGALISVGGRDTAQPELGSIVRLRPSIVRLGRAWVRGLDTSATRRSAIEVTGRLAAQLDAWILAEDVETAAELRALSELGVPLAQGPFVGAPQAGWPGIAEPARIVLPAAMPTSGGVLRALLRRAYTTQDAAAARQVLPEASGFETVVVIDDAGRPVALLERGADARWEQVEALTVNVDTPVADAAARAMARPRDVRFTPLMCTDAAGRFLGILTIEDLVAHLSGSA